MTPMALDITVGLVIFMSGLIAYFRGIVKEFFTLAALVLGAYLSYEGGYLWLPTLNNWLHVPAEGSPDPGTLIFHILTPGMLAKVIAYGGTFLVVFLIVTLLGYLLTLWLKKIGLGVVDRLLGGAFGLARGFLLVFLIYVPFTYLLGQSKFPAWAAQSVSVPILQNTLTWANTYLDLDKVIEDHDNGIAIKINKLNFEKLFGGGDKAAADLKEEVKKEEQNIQKAMPDVPPQPQPAPAVAAPVPASPMP